MIEELKDILFPAPCLLCGKRPKPLCEECEPAFTVARDSETSFYASELDEGLGQLMRALKDKNRTAMLPIFARGLRPCLLAAIEQTQPSLLVCPPSSKKNFRKRGLNPAFEILKRAAPGDIRVSQRALAHQRQPEDQRNLNQTGRLVNVSDLFRARIKAERVLLFDDVKTTGSTLQSAKAALEKVGVEVVGTCVLAKRI